MSNSINISIDNLSKEIDSTLKMYCSETTEKIKKQTKESMNDLVKSTKKDAPRGKRKKHYYSSIKSKKTFESEFDITYTWYVDNSNYRLSHLLEDGHKTVRVKNGKSYTKAYKFISKNASIVEDDFLRKTKEILKNG